MAASAFAPLVMSLSAGAVVVFAAARRPTFTLLAAGCAIACIATQAPRFVGESAPTHARSLTVLTANMRLGEADPSTIVDLVRDQRIDLLALEELTPKAIARLVDAGIAQYLPYSLSRPKDVAAGAGLWSRFPLTSTALPGQFEFSAISASVRVPDVSAQVDVLVLHMPGPWPNADNWARDIARLPQTLDRASARNPTGTVIVAGDFNATLDNLQFRRVLDAGFRDAGEQSGAGSVATYPANGPIGPMIGIDHVLTRGAVATRARTVALRGSDHRGLVAKIAIPTSTRSNGNG